MFQLQIETYCDIDVDLVGIVDLVDVVDVVDVVVDDDDDAMMMMIYWVRRPLYLGLSVKHRSYI